MSQLWWYAARSGGLVAFTLMAASMIWGLALSGKVRPGKVRPNWILDLHRFLGGLSVVFVGVHVASIMLDSYTHFGVADVLVPFVSTWKPLAVAWGMVALYLLLAVELTSLARKHLPKKWWRRIHGASFPMFLLSSVHLFTAGTDSSQPIVIWGTVAAWVVVSAMTAWRIYQALQPPAPPRRSLLHHSPTFEGTTERELIGVFEVAADREPARQPAHGEPWSVE